MLAWVLSRMMLRSISVVIDELDLIIRSTCLSLLLHEFVVMLTQIRNSASLRCISGFTPVITILRSISTRTSTFILLFVFLWRQVKFDWYLITNYLFVSKIWIKVESLSWARGIEMVFILSLLLREWRNLTILEILAVLLIDFIDLIQVWNHSKRCGIMVWNCPLVVSFHCLRLW